MMKTSLFAAMLVVAVSGVAGAGGQTGSIGVGAEAQLSGLGGASVSYDAGQFHVGGFLGYDRVTVNTGMGTTATENIFEIGGRFYYHMHSTAMSDFGLGGGLDLASVPGGGGGNNRNTLLFLEPGFQIRLFMASNVALSFSGGLVIGVLDADTVAITGQIVGGNAFAAGNVVLGLTGGAGVHYYFF